MLISRFYEQFLRNGSGTAVQKNFKLIKYEHIIYHFEARGLEISNISRNIQISRKYEQKQISRNFLKCS